MHRSVLFSIVLLAVALLGGGQLSETAAFPTAAVNYYKSPASHGDAKLLRRQDNGGGDGGDQGGNQAPPPPPAGVSPFPANSSQTSLWALISGNPSFSNFTQLVVTHDAGLVNTLNTQIAAGGPPPNVTVFAPPDSAFADLVSSPFWQLLSLPIFSPVARQLIALHIHNGSAVTSNQVPPEGQGNVTLSSLSMFSNITLQYASQRPVSGLPGPLPVAPQEPNPDNNGQVQGNAPPDQPDVGGNQEPPPGSNPALPPPAPPAPNNTNTDNATQLYANSGQVIYKDVIASNGVLHVVDQLLTPFFGKNASSTTDLAGLFS